MSLSNSNSNSNSSSSSSFLSSNDKMLDRGKLYSVCVCLSVYTCVSV